MNEMSMASRQAEIIRILIMRRKETVRNLAHEMGVNERTIRRDLLTLTVEGRHLINTKQGNGGGVIYEGDLYPYKGILSKDEKLALGEAIEKMEGRCCEILKGMLMSYG